MSLYHTLQNIEGSALGQFIQESTWLFPAIESTHLLALATLGGAVLIVALAVLGVGLRTPPPALLNSARPVMTGAIVTLIVSGLLLAVSEPLKLYDRPAFEWKMMALLVALLVTYGWFVPGVKRGDQGLLGRSEASLTMVAWLSVGVAGRWVGFS
jgi:hypothetical protein